MVEIENSHTYTTPTPHTHSTHSHLTHTPHTHTHSTHSHPHRYVNSLDPCEHTLTIRIKLCHLIETLMTKSRDLSFRAEVQFRNQVAQVLARWLRGEVYISENISHEQNLHK